MAFACVFEIPGADQDEYDAMTAAIGRGDIAAGGPPGLVAHMAGAIEQGWRVIDVWDTEAAARAYYDSERFRTMVAGAPPSTSQESWSLYRLEVLKTMCQHG